MGLSVKRRKSHKQPIGRMSSDEVEHFEKMMRRDVEKQRKDMQQQSSQQIHQQHQQHQQQPQQQDVAFICTLASQEVVLNRAVVIASDVFSAMTKVVDRFNREQEDLPTLTIKVDIADVIE